MMIKTPKHAGYSMPSLYVSNGKLKYRDFELDDYWINSVLDRIITNDAIYLDADVLEYMLDYSHDPELFNGKLLFKTEDDFINYIYNDVLTN